MDRSADFNNVGADLEARANKRIHVEETIQRLRSRLRSKLQIEDSSVAAHSSTTTGSTTYSSVTVKAKTSDRRGSNYSSSSAGASSNVGSDQRVCEDLELLSQRLGTVKQVHIAAPPLPPPSNHNTANKCSNGTIAPANNQANSLVSKLQVELFETKQVLQHSQRVYAQEVKAVRKNAMGRLDDLESKLEGKEEQIEFYEFKLRNQKLELQTLKDDLKAKARRNTELEVELETHSLQYLAERNTARLLEQTDFDDLMEGQSPTRAATNRVNQAYIKKLQTDLAALEQKFLQEKIDGALQISALQKEAEEKETKIQSLQRHLDAFQKLEDGNHNRRAINLAQYGDLRETQSDSSSDFDSGTTNTSCSEVDDALSVPAVRPSLVYIKERMELLEMENISYRTKIKDLGSTLEHQQRTAKQSLTISERQLSSTRKENAALQAQIEALDTDLSFAYGEIDSIEVKRRCARLDKQIEESTADILSLEDQLNAKDDQIANLRAQLVDKRVGAVDTRVEITSSKQQPDSSHTSRWNDDDNQSGGTEDETVSSCILEMQGQLQACRKQLVSREAELNRLRSYYAGRIADLKVSTAETIDRRVALFSSKQTYGNMFFL